MPVKMPMLISSLLLNFTLNFFDLRWDHGRENQCWSKAYGGIRGKKPQSYGLLPALIFVLNCGIAASWRSVFRRVYKLDKYEVSTIPYFSMMRKQVRQVVSILQSNPLLKFLVSLKFLGVLLSGIFVFSGPALASEDCRRYIEGFSQVREFRDAVKNQVEHYERNGYLTRQSGVSVDEFSCHVFSKFAYLGPWSQDENLARRPLYLLESLKYLGINSLKRKPQESFNPILSFVGDLIVILKQARLPELDFFSLDKFGIIDPKSLLGLAVELNTRKRDDGWFEISLQTSCRPHCDVSLEGIPLTIRGLNLKSTRISPSVTLSFQGDSNREQFVRITKDLLVEKTTRLQYIHSKFRKWFRSVNRYEETLQERWEPGFFPPQPLHLQVTGLEFRGSYAMIPLKGQLERILIYPGIAKAFPYTAPVLVSLTGKWGGFLSGNVVVTDYMD
jgi:hypothetical protein